MAQKSSKCISKITTIYKTKQKSINYFDIYAIKKISAITEWVVSNRNRSYRLELWPNAKVEEFCASVLF
jgi:hypothetical protein